MTRKDYVLIAQAMYDIRPASYDDQSARVQWELDCESLAQTFKRHNPRFDHKRFFEACNEGTKQ